MKKLSLLLMLALPMASAYAQPGEDAILKVEVALSEGDYNRALVLLNLYWQGGSWRYNQLRGVVFENIGRYDSASLAYKRAIDLDSTYIPARKGYARSLYSYGDTKEAKRQYQRILAEDSLCVNTRLQYAGVLKREGDYSGAHRSYCWLTHHDSTNFYFWEQRADCALQLNYMLDAINSYDAAVRLNRQNLDIAAKYAKLLTQLQVPAEDVMEEIDCALKVDSLHIPLLKLKGKLFADQKRYKEMLAVLTRVYELGDSSFFTSKYLGIGKYSTGLYFQSIADFERAFGRDSSDAFLNFVFSASLFRIGDRNRALEIADYTERILTPDSALVAVIYDLKGDIHVENRAYGWAVECYEKAQRYSKGEDEFTFKIGKSHYFARNYKVSAKYLESYIARAGDESEQSKPKKRSNLFLAKLYLDEIKKEFFFRDTL